MPRLFKQKLLMIGLSLLLSSPVWGEGLTYQTTQINTPQSLDLTVGTSKIIETPQAFNRASLAEPEIADTIVLSTKQVYVTAKKLGTTTLTLWSKDGKVSNVLEVRVTPDVTRLKEQFHSLLPKEPDLQVMASGEHITVAGNVTNVEALNRALVLAEPFAPKKIINMMQVGGVQQVMMEVKISEMQRGLLKRLGVNFTRRQLGHRDFSIGTLNELSSINALPFGSGGLQEGAGGLQAFASTAATALLGFNVGNDAWTVTLDMLKEHGLSKSLAEPTLITESGQAASFLVGGEFPVPIPQTFNTLSIKYKEFGVGLKFTPTVLSNERISIVVNPEVSELDFANGIQLGGFQVPALITRRVKTVVELGDGQSFAIAGMLQDNIRETIAKYPVLGDIPILGALFRSTSFEKNETELIVIVTPHLVKPLNMVHQTLPTDHYLEPNDFELMLMGYVEGVYPEKGVPRPSEAYQVGEPRMATRMPYRNGGIEGVFGHLAP